MLFKAIVGLLLLCNKGRQQACTTATTLVKEETRCIPSAEALFSARVTANITVQCCIYLAQRKTAIEQTGEGTAGEGHMLGKLSRPHLCCCIS